MYRKPPANQLAFENFDLPFGGKLNGENRWVRLAELVPWEEVEAVYAKQFLEKAGAPAKPARVAFGALLVKERLGLGDEETVEQIRENPYLQYFLGFHGFSDEPPFDPSMFVYFRKRFSLEDLKRLNVIIASGGLSLEETTADDEGGDDDTGSSSGEESSQGGSPSTHSGNRGKLLLDATCAPADIRYPTDIDLLKEARKETEAIIDILFAPLKAVDASRAPTGARHAVRMWPSSNPAVALDARGARH